MTEENNDTGWPSIRRDDAFRRLCQRIANNDPSLSTVAIGVDGFDDDDDDTTTPGAGGWSDDDARRFAAAMSSNTVVDRVDIALVNSRSSTNPRGPGDDRGPITCPDPVPSGARRETALSAPTNSLLSLAVSTRVGRALLRVSEVRLVGIGAASDDDNLAAAEETDKGSCSLLLHVLLNILGTSTRLWSLRLVDVGFCPASSLGLLNFLRRTASLRSLDFVRCGIVLGVVGAHSDAAGRAARVVPDAGMAEAAQHQESPRDVAATTVYRALALNASIENVVVDYASTSSSSSSSTREGSFLLLNAVASGLLQLQSIHHQRSNMAPTSAKIVGGRSAQLRAFELQLSRLENDPLPLSLMRLLETTTACEIRIQGGAAPNLSRILEACCQNLASANDRNDRTTRKLHLKGCTVSPADVARLCEHISGATALTELAVHEMDLGLDGVRLLARAISSPKATLQVLDLFDIYVEGKSRNDGGDAMVAALFRDALRTNRHLRALRLGEVPLGMEAGGSVRLMGALQDATQLRELDLFHVQCLDLQLLASGCGNLTRLGLVLCCCGIGPLRLSQFLAALQTHAPRLQDLDLSSNRFGNAEAVVVSVHVKRSTALRRLALDQNDITDGGATLLFRSLANHPTMAELSLSGNRLGGPAVMALLESLPEIHLQHLALWWDAGDDRERSPAADALLRTLASNSSLVGLNLENNVGRAYRPFIEYYLYRNRLYPWLHEHPLAARPFPVSSALWPQALERLSRKEASAAYFVMREKLPLWKT